MDRRPPPHRHNTPQHSNARTSSYSLNSAAEAPLRSPSLGEPPPIFLDPFNRHCASTHHINGGSFQKQRSRIDDKDDDDVHREQPIAATPLETRLDHVQVMMSQLLKAAQDLVEDMKKDNNRRRDQSSSRDHPRYEVHHPNSVLHQAIQEAPLLASSLFKQLETESIEIIAPAPDVQDSVNRSEDVRETFVQVQELQESDADQMFDEMPQPIIQVDDDDNESAKNQELEVSPNLTVKDIDGADEEISVHKTQEPSLQMSQFNSPSKVLGIQHIQEISEFGIKFFIDDERLETNLSSKLIVQDDAIVFPMNDSGESSYFVEDNSKLKTHNVMVVHHFLKEISMNVAEKERIGVG